MLKKILRFVIFAALVTPTASAAQNDLFVGVPETKAALADTQLNKVNEFRKARTTTDVRVVKINVNLLKAQGDKAQAKSLNLNFSADKAFGAVATKIDRRGENDFTWQGDVPGKPSNVTLVVNGENVTGSATIANEIYAIEPLGSGMHAIIRKDAAKFPPDHPPGFEKLERSKKSFEDRKDQRGDDSGQIIRILVAYTPAVASAHADINSFVRLAIDETNTSYQNSQVVPRLELAHAYQVAYTESGDYDTDLGRFRENNDGFMDEVHALRDAHAADVAVLIFNNNAYCGLASDIMANANNAFAVVHHECATGYYSFGHEIGHLQGARHNPEADSTNSPFVYGHGYYNAIGHWRTVMSYNCPGDCTRLPQWSNPNVNYQNAPTGTAATHHNARALNETARTVANFRTGPRAGSSGEKDATRNFFQNHAPNNNNYELVVREGGALRHYWFAYGGDWQWHKGALFGSNVQSEAVMFQNHAPGNFNYELVVQENNQLRHYWFSYGGDWQWHQGALFGANVQSEAAMLQNHAPNNVNYELAVREGAQLRHYWFSYGGDWQWHPGALFGANVQSEPAMFQNHAAGNHNYELVVREANNLQHYWFGYGGNWQWNKGAAFGANVASPAAMFQNRAAGNSNYELVVREANNLQHYWFGYGGNWQWNKGAAFGANAASPPALFQNHAAGNSNYELVVREANNLQHYWFGYGGNWQWNKGLAFGANVASPPVMFQNGATGNDNYELVVGEGNARRHYWFGYGGNWQWNKGLTF